MSSSEPSQRRFYGAFAAALAGTLALIAGVMVVVDPLGATGGNALCAAGANAPNADGTKEFVAHRMRPHTLVLGTSRVKWGFAHDALDRLGPAAANAGIEGGVPADFAFLAAEALSGGRLERVFIGIDFNSFHQQAARDVREPISEDRFSPLGRWRLAFASYAALRSLPSAMLDCRPRFHSDGAPVLDAGGRPLLPPADEAMDRALVRSAFTQLGRPNRERLAARLADLRGLIVDLRARGVDVVLFSAPYQENLLAIFDETGLRGDFEAFHAAVARVSRKEGVPFVDLHTTSEIEALNLPPCAGGGIGCHYLDLTHYSPLVGDRIAQRLAVSRP